jgi:outer membrane protein assembly factor BamD
MGQQTTSFILLVALSVLIVACGGTKKVSLDPKKYSDKQLYDIGLQHVKDENYEEAREAFRVVFENFPKSDYRILAKLAIANSHYQQGNTANYVLAVQEYQDFIALFPFSPKAEFAQYQIGLCYYNMLEKPDRDQTETRKALDEFRKVIDTYPKGAYYKKAYSKLLDCYRRLAEHEYIVARFYQRTGRHSAAVDRLKGILKNYPEPIFQAKHYYNLAKSLQEMDQFSESCTYYSTLLKKWPKSEYAQDAQNARQQTCSAPKNASQ